MTAERVLRILLWINAVVLLLAAPFALLPFAWMAAVHRETLGCRCGRSLAIRFGNHYLAYREILAPQRGGEGESGAKKKTNDKRTQQPSRPCQPPADHPWRKRVVR